eukprot:5710918-Pyramimonas_sp.AAC.1
MHDPHLMLEVLQDVYQGTCFAVRGDDDVARTLGARPGSTMGDMVCNVSFSPILEESHRIMKVAGLAIELPA